MDMRLEELRKILQNAVLASWASDEETLKQIGLVVSPPLENPLVIQIMDAEYRKTLGELSNLTRTTMDQAQKDLINLMDEAEMRVTAGAESYTQATADVLDRWTWRDGHISNRYEKNTGGSSEVLCGHIHESDGRTGHESIHCRNKKRICVDLCAHRSKTTERGTAVLCRPRELARKSIPDPWIRTGISESSRIHRL